MKSWKVYLTLFFLGLASVFFLSGKEKGQAEERLPQQALKIGVSLYRGDDEFISSVSRALEEEKSHKEEKFQQKMTLNILDAKNSQTIQNAQIDQFIRKNYDVIVVNVVDRTVAATLIHKAKQGKIPIIFFNREPIETDLLQWDQAFYVGSRAQESGEMQGQLVWQAYLENPDRFDLNGDGKIQYVMLEGEEVHQDSLIRTETSIQSIVDAGVKVERLARGVGNWMRQPSKEFMSQWLKEFDQPIELVISNNDEMALGAVEALQSEKQMPPPQIVGIDGTKEGIEAVDNGQMLGTILADTTAQAKGILDLAYATSQNRPIKEIEPKIKDQYLWIPHQIYTIEK